MAKRKNDPTPTEDYIAQLEWRAQHRRRVPVRFEPKWKYKIVYRFPSLTLFGRVMQSAAVIGLVSLIIYFTASSQIDLEGKIFYSVILGLIVTIIFFAVRDASKDQDEDSEDVD